MLFKNKLERRGIRVYTHRATRGYPTDVDLIVSDEGYGANAYIETEQAAGRRHRPRSGQRQAGHLPVADLPRASRGAWTSGYAKFETFPIWNLPLQAPGQRGLRGRDRRHARLQPDRSVPPRGLRRDDRQLQPRRRGLPRADADPGADHRRRAASTGRRPTWASTAPASASSTTRWSARPRGRRSSAATSATPASTRMGLATKETVQRVELLMKELGARPEDRRVVAPAREAAATRPQPAARATRASSAAPRIELRGRPHRRRQELAADARGLQPAC